MKSKLAAALAMAASMVACHNVQAASMEVIKNFDQFLGAVHRSKVQGEYTDKRINYDAFVSRVGTMMANDHKSTIYFAELGPVRTGDHVSPGLSNMTCVLRKQDYDRVHNGNRIAFNGVIKQVTVDPRWNGTVGMRVDEHTVIAVCEVE
jgi:hypothetical protein